MIRFIHTADWQIGKPFACIEHPDKRARLRHERIEMIRRIGEAVRERQVSFVLVAGDLFDSSTPDTSTVSAACRAIGSIDVPVLVIPGNHDHGGPGSVWEQEFFLREKELFANNHRLLAKPEMTEESGVCIFPCPLIREQSADDITSLLRDPNVWTVAPAGKPRVILAHGSVQGLSSVSDDEEPMRFEPEFIL
ncbi:MAG: metallophosphoesterase [Candidatus Riflebacteria bacterium]|nr:metallophosphoesterase [Candidatus Riflebacteria bacterium]